MSERRPLPIPDGESPSTAEIALTGDKLPSLFAAHLTGQIETKPSEEVNIDIAPIVSMLAAAPSIILNHEH